ncbi:4-hydroxybenzoate octaprenyltransferase [Alishewanella sp. HL-SH05]|uniref:4-hydroxybenzoate octaprenyltransferase n=1 Tax=Alishewanella sp. HL-SH05 TaxID=3461145 RepID=UPI004041B4C0
MSWQLRWQQRAFYSQLMRLDKPIGIYLLLWPTWWALWLAAEGIPSFGMWLVFTLGVILMRSAGCVINDYADRKVDGQVERTKNRPLATGAVTAPEALQLFVLLLVLAASLLLFLNKATQLLALVAVLLASCYPFMKRYTHLPQVVLGAAYSWGIPMAFMAYQGEIPGYAWALYLANLCWTVAYDTYYALVDRPDDLQIGVKSTAILFGAFALPIIALLQLIFLTLLSWIGWQLLLGWPYYLAIVATLPAFAYQHWLAYNSRQGAFKAFLHNHYVGLIIFIGLFVSFAQQSQG